ncbi:hypothetical protein ABFS82_08G025600 [Erythranthe guttata]|uniref:Uncharacterized protein n=1 Tax=Erythranthe guttata TaxID=4155 RepID=A0A022RVP7_ERYGU|nr:PREDICTED: uncharacterized protein At5g39570-like [Erythranthe guttata]EYU44134.1 hypothetical protein MIMGU_mgv1a011784mg [Erythranthe guttata]|eukprot:XP_012851132.1 PREDICTED: uncharacterized protein At5g39570-like [Erythranthe guttata]
MSYFPKGHHDGDAVDDFDEFDSTPYGGGYDIVLTYGRPLPPSEETCYPITSSGSESFDYDRPQYTSYAEPSAYGDEALDNEYKSYARPKPRPARPSYGGPPPSEPGYGYDRPKPSYGGESEYGSGGGSEFGGRPEYGSGGYGRKSEYEEPAPEYGRKSEPEYGGSGYGRRPEAEEYGSGGYVKRPEYGEEEGGGGGGGYGRPTSYQAEGYERPSYGRSEEEDYRKPSYERREGDDDEGYGRKKYGDENSGDDEDEEKKHRHKHHHRKHYDD